MLYNVLYHVSLIGSAILGLVAAIAVFINVIGYVSMPLLIALSILGYLMVILL